MAELQTAELQTTGPQNKHWLGIAGRVLGLAFFNSIFLLPVSPFFLFNAVSNPLQLIVALAAFIVPAVIVRLIAFYSYPRLTIYLLALLSALFALIAIPFSSSFFGGIFAMASVSCNMLLWDLFSFRNAEGVRSISIGILLSAIVGISSPFIPQFALDIIFYATPLLSIVCFFALGKNALGEPEKLDKNKREKYAEIALPKVTIICMVASGFALGFAIYFVDTVNDTSTWSNPSVFAGIALLMVGIILLLARETISKTSPITLLGIFVILLFPLMILLVLGPSSTRMIIAMLVFTIGLTMSEFTLSHANSALAKYDLPSMYAIGYLRSNDCLFFSCGILISYLSIFYGSFDVLAVLSIIAFVYILLISWFIVEQHDKKVLVDSYSALLAQFNEKQPKKWQEHIGVFAAQYNLTARQSEVLRLLLMSKNATQIAKELYVSTATAKSHINAIYKGVDVHSQRDLISKFDESFAATQNAKDKAK